MNYEVIGILASLFVLGALTFNSTSLKTNILMRSVNTVGSVLFVVYGVLVSAWSTAVCNGLLTIVNIFYIVKMAVKLKKENKGE